MGAPARRGEGRREAQRTLDHSADHLPHRRGRSRYRMQRSDDEQAGAGLGRALEPRGEVGAAIYRWACLLPNGNAQGGIRRSPLGIIRATQRLRPPSRQRRVGPETARHLLCAFRATASRTLLLQPTAGLFACSALGKDNSQSGSLSSNRFCARVYAHIPALCAEKGNTRGGNEANSVIPLRVSGRMR